MADVNDPHNYDTQLKNIVKRIKKCQEIDDATTAAIEEFVEAQRKGRVADEDELATSTLTTYLTSLRKILKRIDNPLLEADTDEIDEALNFIARSYAATTHNNTLCGLYVISDYHDLGLRGQWEAIERNQSKVDVDRLLSDDEVISLIDVGDLRDKTMIGLFADTGCRVGALCSFRIRDLYLEGDIPQLAFNTNAPTKTADGKLLLTWSRGHIETYLSNEHPQPDTPNAPLIHKKERFTSMEEDCALSPKTVRQRIKKLGEKVGIARDRMKPHTFRHTAVSNWIRQGWQVDDIVHRASWAGPQMLEVYDNVTDEMRNEDLAATLGIVDDDDIVTDPSEATIPCPRCDYPVHRNANYCGKCSLEMSRAPSLEEDKTNPKRDRANSDPKPKTVDSDEVWSDGAGEVFDDISSEVLMRELVERTDMDPQELLEDQ